MSSIVKKLAAGEELTLTDVTCSICLSLMMEPVKLPCDHVLCHPCFSSTLDHANLMCPLCRTRISVWCRRATKTKTIVDQDLWSIIQTRFPDHVESGLRGEDSVDVDDVLPCQPVHNIAQTGDIGSEFAEQVRRAEEEERKRREEEERLGAALAQEMEEEEQERRRKAEEEETLGLEAARRLWRDMTNTPVTNKRKNRSVLELLNSASKEDNRNPSSPTDEEHYNFDDLIVSPELIEEQRRIEERLQQEKEDEKVAKILQNRAFDDNETNRQLATPKSSRKRQASGNEQKRQKSLFDFSPAPSSSKPNSQPSSSSSQPSTSSSSRGEKEKCSNNNVLDMLKKKVENETMIDLTESGSSSGESQDNIENDEQFARELQNNMNRTASPNNAFAQLLQQSQSKRSCHMNHKSKSCSKCTGCLKENCGKCSACRDMTRFGGKGVLRQKCVYRKCINPTKVKCSSCQ